MKICQENASLPSSPSSFVRTEDGAVRLYVNGKKTAPAAYTVYYTENQHYASFADAGYRLFSIPCAFAYRTCSDAILPAPDGLCLLPLLQAPQFPLRVGKGKSFLYEKIN